MLPANITHGRRAFWLVFALALTARAVYVLQIQSSPLYEYPVVDGKTYVLHAESLAAGNWLGRGQEPFWQPPLYPYLLGLVKTAFPHSFFDAIRLLQALFGALTCALTSLLGARLFSPGVGLAAGLAAALYGPLIFFDGELLPATLATLLDVLGLLLLHRALQREAAPAYLGAGLVFGLAALAVPTVLGFVTLAGGWISWKKRAALPVAAFALGAILAIAPVTWRNYAIGGDRVLISYNAGINFYIGNNAGYEQTLHTRPGWEWDDLVGRPRAAGAERPSQRSAYFWDLARDYMRTQPLDYLVLQARKGLQLFGGDEEGRNQDIYYWRRYSPLLATTLWKGGLAFPFGVVGPLALLGLALALRCRGVDLATLFVLAYSAGVIAFFPAARYRVPLLPVLLLLAAHAGWWLWDAFQRSEKRRQALALAALLGLGLVLNWGAGPMDVEGDAEIHYNLGQAHAHRRQAAAARQAFARAVERDSTYWQAWLNLGSMTAIQGDMQEAAAIFARVAHARPERAEVWVNLAHSHMGLRQYADAVRAYEQALQVDAHQPRIYAELMQVHLQQGDAAAARQVLEAALARYPRDRQKLLSLFSSLQQHFEQMPQ